MDVIINNPPAQTATPVITAPAAPVYTQGYGVAPQPMFYRAHDHDGPGFFGILFLVLGSIFLFRLLRMRRWWARRMRGGSGGPWGHDWRAMKAAWESERRDERRPGSSASSASTPPSSEKDRPDPSAEREDWAEFIRRGRERIFGDRALEIIRERFARGEINPDEYERLRRGLLS